MHTTITGSDFQEMLLYGAAAINKEKQSINDLNVFPVPDGDTGTNMGLTMQAAATELKKRTPATIELASTHNERYLRCGIVHTSLTKATEVA